MPTNPDYSKIAAQLIGSKPLDYSHKDDGSLVVIAPNGQKFKFTFDQVDSAQLKLTPKTRTQTKRSSTAKKDNS